MANTKLKRAARARQKQTGERYTEALARVREAPMPTQTEDLSLSDAFVLVDEGWKKIEERAQQWKERAFPQSDEPPFDSLFPDMPMAWASNVELAWIGVVVVRAWFSGLPSVAVGEQIIKPLNPELKFSLRPEEVLGEKEGEQFNGILQAIGRLGLIEQGKTPMRHHPRVEWHNFRVYGERGAVHEKAVFRVAEAKSPLWAGRRYTKEDLQPLWDDRTALFESAVFAYQAEMAKQRKEGVLHWMEGPVVESPPDADYALDQDGSPSYL